MPPPTVLPEFPATLEWLDRPALARATGLRDHVVLLLLWRLGCVHSRHALAELATVQAACAGRAFAAIAVHTPVDPAEFDPARLRRVLSGPEAPVAVAVDRERALAKALGAAALPYCVLADADGTVVFAGTGEPAAAKLVPAVAELLARAERQGRAARVPFAPVAPPPPPFAPTAIALAPDGPWVAAGPQRRVFAIDRDGAVRLAVGSGRPGQADGAAALASFRWPAGLWATGSEVFVADPLGHVLRSIDRGTGIVRTRGGNGRRSTDRFGGGFGDQQGWCGPTGIADVGGTLHVAMTGAHQLWQFDPATTAATAWLGTGARSQRDGGEVVTFAEPLGLGATPTDLYVADAGNGSLRRVELAHRFLRTLAQGLRRPTAVAPYGEEVLVAAGWEPAVRRWSAAAGLQPWVGATEGLVEPVGLAVDGEECWIADAGAGALFVGRPAAGPALRRVELRGLPLPPLRAPAPGSAELAAPVRLRAGADATLCVALPVGPGEVVDVGALCSVDVVDEAAPVLAADRHAAANVFDGAAELLVPVGAIGRGAVRLAVTATVRCGPTAAPVQRTWRYVVPVEVAADGAVRVAVAAVSGSSSASPPATTG